jgi:tetratricopeptide (TPR) repeat protein
VTKALLIGLIGLISISSSNGQEGYDSSIDSAFLSVLQREPAVLQSDIASFSHTDQATALKLYLKQYDHFLDVIFLSKQRDYKTYLENKKKTIAHLKRGKDEAAGNQWMICELYLQESLLHLNFSHFKESMISLVRSYRWFEKSRRHDNKGYQVEKLEIMFRLLANQMPGGWFGNIVFQGTQGDMTDASSLLRKNIDRLEPGDPRWLEIKILQMIEGYTRDDKGISYSLKISEKDNPIVAYLHALNLRKNNMNDSLIHFLEEYLSGSHHMPLPQHYLLLGEAKLNMLSEEAPQYIMEYLDHNRGPHGIKTAHQKLAWYYYLKGDKRWLEEIEKVKAGGTDLYDSDKQAMIEVSDTSRWNKSLITARLLFDGGYYFRCKNWLSINSGEQYNNASQKLEYLYRLARTEQLMGDHEPAIHKFKLVIDMGKDAPYYYAANAAYQTGLLYEGLGKKSEAAFYYSLCLDMPVREYRRSIFNRTRKALKRLEG